MRKPTPALIGSIALHGGVAALALIGFSATKEEPRPLVNSVPVSIVSEMVIEAAAPDNPQPEPSPEDGATAPVETTVAPPEPTPAPPEPKPTPPAPRPTPPAPRPEPAPRPTPTPPAKKAETPRPTPPRETPREQPRPTPPREQPRPTPPRETPRPNPPREAAPAKKAETPRTNTPPRSTNARPAERAEAGLDLDALRGPARPTGNTGRPATGQQGRGSAPQATGPQITAIFNQVYPHWILPCDIPGADQLRIQVDVTLSEDGRITRGPTLVNAQNTSVYRAAAEGALRALRQAAPFDVPANFPGGQYRPTFNTERACANR